MIGTVDQERMRSTTSEPSMSGRPRSMIARSIGRNVAERIASAPELASCTTKPLSSKPARRKRRIWTSSSTTSTIGEGSLICVAFHLRDGGLRDRELNCQRGAETRPVADGVHLTTIGGDKSFGDPEPAPGTARGRGMAGTAHETVPDFHGFVGGQAAALVADAQNHAAVAGASRHRNQRAGRRIFRGIVEDLH